MKLWFLSLLILFGLMTSKVWATSQTECQLTEGIYQNSQANLGKFHFFSYADIFTINNAKSFIIQVDASDYGIGAVLMQNIDKNDKPIACMS